MKYSAQHHAMMVSFFCNFLSLLFLWTCPLHVGAFSVVPAHSGTTLSSSSSPHVSLKVTTAGEDDNDRSESHHSRVTEEEDDDSILEETSSTIFLSSSHPPPHNRHRRRFFVQVAGIMTTPFMIHTEAVKAEPPSLLSSIQGPVQDAIAPGHWIGQFLGLNSRTVTWRFDAASPEQVSQALVETLQELTPERKRKLYMPNFDITQATTNRVHVRTWTKNEWLDVLNVDLKQQVIGTTGTTGTVAQASFYATGFLPTSIPGAPLWNVGLSFFPFVSPGPQEMLQDFRLRALEGLVQQRLRTVSASTN